MIVVFEGVDIGFDALETEFVIAVGNQDGVLVGDEANRTCLFRILHRFSC